MTIDDGGKGRTPMSDDSPWVQLATRIPRKLHRELKVYCVKEEISVMRFVVAALTDKLRRAGGRRR